MLCYNYSMKKIFEAGSVVIVGVSDWPTNLGRNILQNLIDWGYRGNVYGVNPKGEKPSATTFMRRSRNCPRLPTWPWPSSPPSPCRA